MVIYKIRSDTLERLLLMAKAIICDKCKKVMLIDENNSTNRYVVNVARYSCNESDDLCPPDRIDLCPEYTKIVLSDFIEGMRHV